MRHIRPFTPFTRLPAIAVLLLGFIGFSDPRQAQAATVVYAHVDNPGQIVVMPKGQFLITDIGNLDRTGGSVFITGFGRRLLWQYTGTLDIPHSAYPMPNGDVLIADTGDNRVIEVNRASQIVWDTDNLGRGHGVLGRGTMSDGRTLSYPNDAKPLPDGDVLISARLQNRVIEINRQGRIVRQISGFLHGQHNPTPLSGGNLFIADSGWDRILEVNSSNRIVWQFGGQVNGRDILNWPRDATPLPDGDTLITDSDNNRLIEVTHAGKIVRQYTNLSRPYATAVLGNGDVVVGDPPRGIVELNQKNEIVWQLNRSTGGVAPSSPRHVLNGSFEHVVSGTNWLLRYWRRNDALAYDVPPGRRVSMGRDGHVYHKGKYSARITYQGSSNGIYFGQSVRVTAGARYRFTGWIKTKNVQPCNCVYGRQDPRGHTAEFELNFSTGAGPAPPAPILAAYSGTNGWTKSSVTFTVPYHVRSIGIQCELRGKGTVWFDDVWLQQLK